MESKKITLSDIAKIAGVTIGTVDRAMHNRPGISEETRKRILEIAKKYNYRPDLIGRSLSMKGKKIKIGVLLRSNPSFFWDHVAGGIRAAAKEVEVFGVEPIIEFYQIPKDFTDDDYVNACRDKLRKFAEDKNNACIVVPLHLRSCLEDINYLTEKEIPTVTLNDDIEDSKRIFHIGPDNYQSGRLAAQLAGDFLAGKGRVLLYTAGYSSYGYYYRKVGFMDKMRESFPSIQVVERNSKTIEEAFFGEDIDIRSFDLVCNVDGDTVSKGVDLLVQSNDIRRMKYIGFEINDQAKEYLSKGLIQGIISQDGFSQGYFAMRMLCESLIFGKKPKYDTMYVRIDIILKENMIINDRIVNPYFMGISV
jgi:LacI family transcriptional regulator